MAKKQQVETEVFSAFRLDVSQAELDACIERHKAVLTEMIRAPRPADGLLASVVVSLRILQSDIIARDDKLGRGTATPDLEGA